MLALTHSVVGQVLRMVLSTFSREDSFHWPICPLRSGYPQCFSLDDVISENLEQAELVSDWFRGQR